MLTWLVDAKVVDVVLKTPGKLVEEEDVEVRPEKLPDGILDENIDIHLIRRYFSNDAWLMVMDVIKQKQDNPVYVCKICSHDLHEQPSIVCDHCLQWFHVQCVGLKNIPKKKHWFCRECHLSPNY